MGLPTDPPFDGLGRAWEKSDQLKTHLRIDLIDRVIETVWFTPPSGGYEESYKEIVAILELHGLNPHNQPEESK